MLLKTEKFPSSDFQTVATEVIVMWNVKAYVEVKWKQVLRLEREGVERVGVCTYVTPIYQLSRRRSLRIQDIERLFVFYLFYLSSLRMHNVWKTQKCRIFWY